MPSTPEFRTHILDILAPLQEITCRKMMGEYLLYFRGILIGGIYDNRLLVKPTESAKTMLKNPVYESPYSGAKPLILLGDDDDAVSIITAVYTDLIAEKQ